MSFLPLANILHHKLRSALSALGIAIAVCMLITLAGLSRGSLKEAIDRWNGVDADLIVTPSSTNITMASGGAIGIESADRIRALRTPEGLIAQRVTPVYLARLRIGKQENNVFGVNPGDYPVFSGGGKFVQGTMPDADGRFARWIAGEFEKAAAGGNVVEVPSEALAEHGGLEVAIDTRLAGEMHKKLGDTLDMAGHTWRIVGIFQEGAISRAMVPITTLQYLYNGMLNRATLLFVKLTDPARQGPAVQRIREATHQTVLPRTEYGAMLLSNIGIMLTYVDAVNTLALIIAFLFIMVTLYTMVLQRTREIAILKSMGAGRAFLLRQILWESIMITAGGAAAGIAMSFGAAYAIEKFGPLLTVSITARWIVIALLAAAAGGLAAGLYPAWRATQVDVAEVLTYE